MSEPILSQDDDQRTRIVTTAERLFGEIGFQKTTVADIARVLRMSPANVYRFFHSKAEINEAVGALIMTETEAALERVVVGPGTAGERLAAVIATQERINAERLVVDRRLHEMVEVALNENWPIIARHIETMHDILARVIAQGMADGEFAPGDATAAAGFVATACMRFWHPRLMVECADKPSPTSAAMVAFCLRALRPT